MMVASESMPSAAMRSSMTASGTFSPNCCSSASAPSSMVSTLLHAGSSARAGAKAASIAGVSTTNSNASLSPTIH